jgi:hypothetical protein
MSFTASLKINSSDILQTSNCTFLIRYLFNSLSICRQSIQQKTERESAF